MNQLTICLPFIFLVNWFEFKLTLTSKFQLNTTHTQERRPKKKKTLANTDTQKLSIFSFLSATTKLSFLFLFFSSINSNNKTLTQYNCLHRISSYSNWIHNWNDFFFLICTASLPSTEFLFISFFVSFKQKAHTINKNSKPFANTLTVSFFLWKKKNNPKQNP